MNCSQNNMDSDNLTEEKKLECESTKPVGDHQESLEQELIGNLPLSVSHGNNCSAESIEKQDPAVLDNEQNNTETLNISERIDNSKEDENCGFVIEITEKSSNILNEDIDSRSNESIPLDPPLTILANVVENSQDIPVENTSDKQSDVFLNAAQTEIKCEQISEPNLMSSLALITQYETEDDSDDDVREVSVNQAYQTRCVEIDSDSSTSDVEFLTETCSPINLDDFDVTNGGEDGDEEENIRSRRQPKVKGELDLEDLPPIEDLHITVPEEECIELGKICSIVEQLVLVNSLPGTLPLDLETILFRDKGTTVLGEVFDVLGQVSDPLYCVRFNSNKQIKDKGIEVGQTVYVAPQTKHTQFVVLANLMKVRGSDASWENDVEPPPRFIDYSDDEEERSARRPNRKRQSSGSANLTDRGSYNTRSYRGGINAGGEMRQPYRNQLNCNIVGNSWHSNFYQTPTYNQSHYRLSNHPQVGYIRPNLNSNSYPQPLYPNSGLVVNPYAVYQTSQPMQQQPYPPYLHQQQPPPQ